MRTAGYLTKPHTICFSSSRVRLNIFAWFCLYVVSGPYLCSTKTPFLKPCLKKHSRILLMLTYMMKNYKIKVKLLLKTKFSISSSVNTKSHNYFCPVFPSLLIIVHFTLDRSCFEIFFGNAFLTSFVYTLGTDWPRAGVGGVWWGGCFSRVRGVCSVLWASCFQGFLISRFCFL